jgi:hypothetical protein
MSELPIDWNARRRQAARSLGRALDAMRRFELSLNPPPAPETWVASRLRHIKDDVAQAYDLITEQVEPDDLLDEMASL